MDLLHIMEQDSAAQHWRSDGVGASGVHGRCSYWNNSLQNHMQDSLRCYKPWVIQMRPEYHTDNTTLRAVMFVLSFHRCSFDFPFCGLSG